MTVDLAIFQCLCILGHHGAIEISFIIIIIYAFSFKVVEVAIPKFRTPLSIWSHLFRGAGHEKRRGEQLKWSLAFRLYIGSFPVHSYQDQFIQPGWAECFSVCI